VAGKPNATVENKNFQDVRSKWLPFFKDNTNTYPNNLAERARRSTTHGAIIKSKTNYAVGQGFGYAINEEKVFKEDLDPNIIEFLNNANNDRESLISIYEQAAGDYVLTGNAYLEVVRANIKGTNQSVMNVFKIDATKVRLSKDRESVYVSGFWRDIKLDENPNKDRHPVENIPLWDGKVDTKQSRFVIHIKNSEPEFDYYGIPEHHAVLKWADIEYQIATFNLTEFENGFFPSALIQMIGSEVPEGMTPKEYVDKFNSNYTGEGKNGKVVTQLVDTQEQAAQIHEFTRDMTGSFTELSDLATKNIISGHRWTPSLTGQLATGGMGQSSAMIINDWHIAMNNLIIPEYQTPLLRLFNLVMEIAGFEVELNIKNKPPVTIQDTLDVKLIMTINEQRAELGLEPLENGGDELIKKDDGKRNEIDNSKGGN
jgi:hypothetical protein